jgi:CBS domain-containing protein
MVLDVKVGSIARRDLVTVDEDASVELAAKLMRDRDLGSLVVTRKGLPVGIVTERDMLKKVLADARDSRSTKVSDIMTSPAVSIEHDRSLSQAIDLMNRRRVRRMLVTENGKIVGIFTQRDVLGLNRLCLHCGKEIASILEVGAGAEPYIQCECAARYHTNCAKTIVHCADCARTLVMNVIYPEPSDTMGG